jgi:hypothetical protein
VWFLCPYTPSSPDWWSRNLTFECPLRERDIPLRILQTAASIFSQAFVSDPRNSICLMPNNAEAYQWGFSYGLVSVLSALTGIWAVGMYGVWWDAGRHALLLKEGRKVGTLRACVDLAGGGEGD